MTPLQVVFNCWYRFMHPHAMQINFDIDGLKSG
jgi:hypothetical protein